MPAKLHKGFTLIELLIVIAVLGILAVAVLSAINPIEQINRSRDTGSKSDAEQLIGAMERYYAIKAYYPWQTAADDSTTISSWTAVVSVTDGTNSILDKLGESTTGAGEIKQTFINRLRETDYNDLYVSLGQGDGSDVVYLCFVPKSKAFQTEAADRCADEGTTLPEDACNSAACKTGAAAAGDCICLP